MLSTIDCGICVMCDELQHLHHAGCQRCPAGPSIAFPHGIVPPPQVIAQLPHHMVEAVADRLPVVQPAARRGLLKEHEHHKHRKYSHYKKHHKPPVRLPCRSQIRHERLHAVHIGCCRV
jgi:hypothetical protein